jgi:hypothetical protein
VNSWRLLLKAIAITRQFVLASFLFNYFFFNVLLFWLMKKASQLLITQF